MAITDEHKEYVANVDAWTADEDFYLGDIQVKSKGVEYLPKLTAKQKSEDYKAFLARGLYTGTIGRAVRGLAGAAMLKEPVIDFPEGRMDGFIKVQDVKSTVLNEIKIGREGLLVDMPAETTPASVLDVEIKTYDAFKITNWEQDDAGNLTRVVLQELVPGQDKDGNVIEVPSYRELILLEGIYEVRIWKENTKGEFVVTEEIIPKAKGVSLEFIPFIFINSLAVSTVIEVSPIQDMVAVAITHYQRFADYCHGLHFTALPTLWATGINKDNTSKIELGSGTALVSKDPEAKFGMIEFTGAGLAAVVTALTMLSDTMAYLGARLLEDPKKGVESAETHRLKQGAEGATLNSIVQAVETGYRLAIEYANVFLGTSVDPVTAFSMSRDFIDAKMTPAELAAIMADWMNGGMSFETYYELKKKGELTRSGVTSEQEQNDINNNMPGMNKEEV